MKALSEPEAMPGGVEISSNIAKYLYSTHLGLNPGSMVMNLMQPFLFAGNAYGYKHLLPAYATAVGEQLGYAAERIGTYGLKPITAAQQDGLFRKHFKFYGRATGGHNVLAIGDMGAFGHVDAMLAAQEVGSTKGTLDKVLDYTMAGFQHTEILNRNVTAHMMENMYRAAGKEIGTSAFVLDTKNAVEQMQFASSRVNTPMLFQTSELFGNPLVRQFLSFPVRSLTTVLETLPAMSEGGYAKGLASTVFRGLMASAVIYEVGKGMFGADMSRGLFASSATDLLTGGGRLWDKQGIVPTPPALDIPMKLIQGMATQDRELLRQAVSRMVPGGVALSKALSVAMGRNLFRVWSFASSSAFSQ
jgi:hypothetical protein